MATPKFLQPATPPLAALLSCGLLAAVHADEGDNDRETPGGATIINSVVNITVNLVDHKMGLRQAIDAGRISVAGAGSTATLETRFANRAALVQVLGPTGLGYTLNDLDVGSVQAVLIDRQTGKQYGGADNRREGTVIGLPRPQGK